MKVESANLIRELRKQAAKRNATTPCCLLKDLLPLLDDFEKINRAAEKLIDDAEECESADGYAVQVQQAAWEEFVDVIVPIPF